MLQKIPLDIREVDFMPELDEKNIALLTEVLPNIADQLRASMAGVYACANRLAPCEARENDPALDKNAAMLALNCHRALRLVGNLSSAALLASNGTLPTENADAAALCREVAERARALFALEDVTFKYESEVDSLVIALNSELFERLLLNLLSNALKFTKRDGEVTLRVRATKQNFLVSVSDTGCGIESERLDTLFDRYLDTARLDPMPHGLGLGLPLCRRIARGHGGSIAAESRVGEGSTFTVALPNKKTDNPTLRDSARFDYAGGFEHTLLELSDALGSEAFLHKYVD